MGAAFPDKSIHTRIIGPLLVLIGTLLLPLQTVPFIKGVSITSAYFVVLTLYILVFRLKDFGQMIGHKCFIWFGAFVFYSYLNESMHPLPDYTQSNQILGLFVGSLFLAPAFMSSRSISLLRTGLMINALWISLILMFIGYKLITSIGAGSDILAGFVKNAAFSKLPFNTNVNFLAQAAALGFGVGTLEYLSASASKARATFGFLVAVISLAGVLMTMSRGGLITAVGVIIVVFLSKGLNRARVTALGLAATAVFMLLTPQIIIKRMTTLRTEMTTESMQDARVQLYSLAFEHYPDYVFGGVGTGNFWKRWGYDAGFSAFDPRGKIVVGVHNLFLQFTIFWGILAPLFLLMILSFPFRLSFYKSTPADEAPFMKYFVLGLAAGFCITNTFYSKELTLLIAMTVGRHYSLLHSKSEA